MRHLFAANNRIVQRRRVASALAAASALLFFSGPASAEAMYRWRDDAGRLHFSNDLERVPAGAEVAKLPEISTARPFSPGGNRAPAAAEPSSATASGSVAPPSRVPECGSANPDRLIAAIQSRLQSLPSYQGADRSLALFIAGKPVSYGPDAIVHVWPAVETDGAAAGAQAAIAYPALGACPQTPPLERYAVTATSPGRAASSSALCADYRRAAREIDMALSRNENVARTFQVAAAYAESAAAGGGTSEGVEYGGINLPDWLVQVRAAQTAELAAETEEFMEELAVAQEEIDRAARAQGCW
jgi:hypothetical protein